LKIKFKHQTDILKRVWIEIQFCFCYHFILRFFYHKNHHFKSLICFQHISIIKQISHIFLFIFVFYVICFGYLSFQSPTVIFLLHYPHTNWGFILTCFCYMPSFLYHIILSLRYDAQSKDGISIIFFSTSISFQLFAFMEGQNI
jgi:hypothetical protein